jgi:hypothetical protein
LPVFSPILGIFGYAKQIAKIANQLTGLAILAMAKPIANLANVTPITAPPGTRRQAWIVMPIRSVNRSVC